MLEEKGVFVDVVVENVDEDVTDWNIGSAVEKEGWNEPEYVVALFLSIQSMNALTFV